MSGLVYNKLGRAICSVHAALKFATAQALRRYAMQLVPGLLLGHFTRHFELELKMTVICSPVSDLRTRESLSTHCRLASDQQNYSLADCLTASEKS